MPVIESSSGRPDYTVINKDCEVDELSLEDYPGDARESPLDVEGMTEQPSGILISCSGLPRPKEGACFDGTYPALIYKCLLHSPEGGLDIHELHDWLLEHTSKSTERMLKCRISKALSSNPVGTRR